MYRLLIVEVSAEARAALRGLLPWQSFGFETVAEADSYTAAVNMALDIRPHAALVAARLGRRSGVELIGQLRTAGLSTAFCVLSDSGEPEHILRAMRAGANDFLLTPADADEVRAFLGRLLSGRDGSGQRADAPADPVLRMDPARLSPLTNKVLVLARSGLGSPPVTLTAIADKLHMNSKYLGRVFLRDTGMRLSEYVTACRMEQARRLITGTQEKISVIAHTVGYSQPNRFYVHFKTYFGVSPGTMRTVVARSEDVRSERAAYEVPSQL